MSTDHSANVLLENASLPPFGAIAIDQIEAALDARLQACRAGIERVVADTAPRSWDSVVAQIEELDDQLNNTWSPVSHLNAVLNSAELREVYPRCLAKLTDYFTAMGQHQGLFEAYQSLASSPAGADLDQAQRQSLDNAIRDFKLAGVALPEAQKQRYAEIQKRLSELSNQFSNQVLDATQGWSKLLTDAADLAGLPDTAREQARQAAGRKGLEGWLITLDMPSYLAVMMHADNRALREEVYTAYCTRASDQGPNAGQWDNTPLIDEILALRHELAVLLDCPDYAACSLLTKMADSPAQVIEFLYELAARSRPQALAEFEELRAFAATEYGIADLQAWDVTFCSEKLRQRQYNISEEALRPYFPAAKVIDGLFTLVQQLFDVEFVADSAVPTWHEDASFYWVRRNGEALAGFYFDLFARENKRGGAWMGTCRSRRQRIDGVQQLPIAYLTCNFTPAVGSTPALLTHNEVTTLFHEFGHGLHHMLTRINVAGVSGISGVAWDAVELPSQFMENWCWQPEVIPMISGHYQSGEPLPQTLLDNMLAAKNFQSALQMLRQLEFALFDLLLHQDFDPQSARTPQQVLDAVRAQVAVNVPPAFNRFQNGFTHIFAGGYAAGYYSYKWAEVLSSDAFARFEEEGIFNPHVGREFLTHILEMGGSKPAMELFKGFRGREPDIGALLRHSGINVSDAS